jgi:hypothetical protein
MKENPALESLRVRTQPCILTFDPVGISPLSAFFMLTVDMIIWLISGEMAQDNKSPGAVRTVF